ncbi:MAG: 2-succinyl-5-enolpyruvyl-6-hydroxy-3-cyclohexene-1-carboxylic-acid synthase [Bacteroidetes bacterium]|nr:2-succinyl-5-enolpyruvyl-6-hydroxy-3-cyclohexene-1-carboxylic-acid synthase [Bacteroidota bacterium]MDA1121485.1 2-succinyl-5-enolpyruvyl-6-hydroxy-3-cyclohexene-1-carboxylic-acid synthase [Bacteroidota bacterium]
MIPQPIIDLAEICTQKGITDAVISPGSRNAPITIAFARHPGIKTYVIPDERSAGFIALGLSQYLNKPVVLICTSGSAVYNYSPAVAEAFYSHVPLIILSADRPPEWIDQKDGQTIHQKNIFGDHVKQSFEFPDTYEHPDIQWHCHRIVNEAINASIHNQQGPIHINIPLREPFYPIPGQEIEYSKDIKLIEEYSSSPTLSEEAVKVLIGELKIFNRVMIFIGQKKAGMELPESIANSYPVISDVISNFKNLNCIRHHDLFLSNIRSETSESITPDLLITFGGATISKGLKTFIRTHRPDHWHIQSEGPAADTFQSLTKIIRTSPTNFIENILLRGEGNPSYSNSWKNLDIETRKEIENTLSDEYWEMKAVGSLIHNLPESCHLHLGNSMPVRWANFLGNMKPNVQVFCNRGTSGIDGSLSTAVGYALECSDPVVVIIGDMSFFYDRNGLWHNHLPDNLRIVVLNNHGGGIFRMIDGPSQQPELDKYFETDQKLNGKKTAEEFDIEYFDANSNETLKKATPSFFNLKGKAKMLEIQTDSKTNKAFFDKLKAQIKNRLKNI